MGLDGKGRGQRVVSLGTETSGNNSTPCCVGPLTSEPWFHVTVYCLSIVVHPCKIKIISLEIPIFYFGIIHNLCRFHIYYSEILTLNPLTKNR